MGQDLLIEIENKINILVLLLIRKMCIEILYIFMLS